MSIEANTADAYKARAMELLRQKKFDEALTELHRALEEKPDFPAAYFHIGAIHLDHGRNDQAVANWQKAIDLKPDYHQAYAGLAAGLRRLGRIDESIAACRKAIEIRPNDADAHHQLALALWAARKGKEAIAEFEFLLEHYPANARAMNNYANMLVEMDHAGRAAEMYITALRLEPTLTDIYVNLARVLLVQGDAPQAIGAYQQAVKSHPDSWEIHSDLLMAMNYDSRSQHGLLKPHKEWAARHAARFYPADVQFSNDRSPDRRLRIGYVSADFRQHAVSHFFEPIIVGHDRSQVEVFCYSNVVRPDAVTRRLRERADGWRDIAGVSDDSAAEMIRTDHIDILVDLGGHTGNHRLLVLARKPAPVQATYLGYPNTTGVATIDYRLTDAVADPPGMTDKFHSETLIRLPGGFLCYRPSDAAPDLTEKAASSSPITFGSFNFLGKLNRDTIRIWCRVLEKVPESTLLIKDDRLLDPATRQGLRLSFIEHNIDPSRLVLLSREPSYAKHLAMYSRIDIGLDPFPYNGTTTTCDTLWMGVPVITLAGRTHGSRVGASLLTRVGLNDLIAHSEDQYVSIATELARNSEKRRSISASRLRERMRSSGLVDARRFVTELESAYRQMWHLWCAK